MVPLLAALAPILVVLVGVLRLPTSRRRIVTHAAMIKELPVDVVGPLRAVPAQEVQAYARLEQERLTTRASTWGRRRRRVAFGTLALAGLTVAAAAYFAFTTADGKVPKQWQGWMAASIVTLYVLAAFVIFSRHMMVRSQTAMPSTGRR